MKLYLRTNLDGVEKIYTAETIDLSLGTIDVLCDAVDIETLDVNNVKDLAMRLIRARKQIIPILHDAFGASEDEVRTVRTTNLVTIIKEIYAFVTEELERLPEGEAKN